jgi:hypothetical protein
VIVSVTERLPLLTGAMSSAITNNELQRFVHPVQAFDRESIWSVRMNKAGQRRQRKLAQRFAHLVRVDRDRFLSEWESRLSSWLMEVHRRGEQLRGEEFADERVFGILQHVDRLLDLCGPEVEALVGRSTRDTIIHESCRVFSVAVDPRLYRIYNRRQYKRN